MNATNKAQSLGISLLITQEATVIVYHLNNCEEMDEDLSEGKVLATFERYEEFVALQDEMLRSCAIHPTIHPEDTHDEQTSVRKLALIVSDARFSSNLKG